MAERTASDKEAIKIRLISYLSAMIRHAKLLLLALLVAFSATSIAEAAPKRVVRHRAKHSTRVSTGASTTRTRAAAARRRIVAKKKARARASVSGTGRVAATKPR